MNDWVQLLMLAGLYVLAIALTSVIAIIRERNEK